MDKQKIHRAFCALNKGNDVREVRIVKHRPSGTNFTCTTSGYFDNADAVVAALESMRGDAPGIYTTLNPVNPDLMARAYNRLQENTRVTASDPDVVRRNWLLVDIDPQRPAQISSSDEEKNNARDLSIEVLRHLQEMGFDRLITADSGNGYHLIYPIDLPNDDESLDLIKRFLSKLADMFDTDDVKVDKTVFNASRIVKLYGTMAAKGDNIPQRPHRISQIRKIIGDIEKPYTVDDLINVAGDPEPEKAKPRQTYIGGGSKEFSLTDFMHKHGIQGREKTHRDYSEMYIVDCPFNAEHGATGEVHIGQRNSGEVCFQCMHNSCSDRSWKDYREFFEPDAYTRKTAATTSQPLATNLPPSSDPVKQNETIKGNSSVITHDWRALLLFNKDGDPVGNSTNNAQVMMSHHPDMNGVLAYNEFAKTVDVIKEPPWGGSSVPREVADIDSTRAAAWLELHGVKQSISNTHSALISAAHRRTYNPLKDYLNGLRWDGTCRADQWLYDFFGVPESEYASMVGRKFLIGAVARALDPGCKMDTMLILEGDQGLKKSTAIRALFGEQWFSDELDDLGSKDSAMQLQGVWCIEMSELTNLSKAEANRAKEWISRRVDRFRPPYGRAIIKAPRQCVLVGSVNPEGGYLKDATGARRFWPVKCSTVNIVGISNCRDQLWAEAVQLYHNKERWWFEGEETKLAVDEQVERYEGDPWADAIHDYIIGKGQTSVVDIMIDCLGLDSSKQNQMAQNRISKILTAEGWKRRRKRVNGKLKWVYTDKD